MDISTTWREQGVRMNILTVMSMNTGTHTILFTTMSRNTITTIPR